MITEKLDRLNQHAYNRSDFAFKKVDSLAFHILCNILLVTEYCKYKKFLIRYRNHWKGELQAYLISITVAKLKTKNTKDVRFKIINDILINKAEILSEDTIKGAICHLNSKENCMLVFNKSMIKNIKPIVDNIIELCAIPNNENAIREYIKQL